MKSTVETVYDHLLSKGVGARFTSHEIAEEIGLPINITSASISRLIKVEVVKYAARLSAAGRRGGNAGFVYELIEHTAPTFHGRKSGPKSRRSGYEAPRTQGLPVLDHGCGQTDTIVVDGERVELSSLPILDLSALFPQQPEPEASKKSLSERLLEIAVEVEALERKVNGRD